MKKMKEGYILTELGEIPEDWELKTFQDVMTGFSSGQTPSRAKPEYYKGDIRWITSGELNYNVITDTIEKITPEAVRRTNLKILPKGTFLIAITGLEAEGTRGSCGIVGEEATTNQSCMALFPKKNLSNDYLFHFYVKYGSWLAFRYCQGTKQQSYTGKIAKILPIILPPTKDEQKAIARALSETDDLIKSLEKLIEKKGKIKNGTTHLLLSGKKRLQGFKDEWKVKQIGQIFKFLGTANNSRSDLSDNGVISYIHYGDIHTKWRNFLDCSTANIPFVDGSKINKNIPLIEEGDLIIADASEDYEGLGACIEVKNVKNKNVVAGLHTILLRGDKRFVADGFKGYLRELDGFYNSLVRLATGVSVYSITKRNLAGIQLSLPSIQEQIAISNVITQMNNEIISLEAKLAKYRLIKKSMMQNLLTGKKRLV